MKDKSTKKKAKTNKTKPSKSIVDSSGKVSVQVVVKNG
jgi:hypothetical protein